MNKSHLCFFLGCLLLAFSAMSLPSGNIASEIGPPDPPKCNDSCDEGCDNDEEERCEGLTTEERKDLCNKEQGAFEAPCSTHCGCIVTETSPHIYACKCNLID